MAPPVNDNFADRIVLSGASGSENGTTVDATEEAGEPSLHGGVDRSVWYEFTPPTTGTYRLKIEFDIGTFPGGQVLVAWYTGAAINSLTFQSILPVAGAQTANAEEGYDIVRLVSGTNYKIKIYSWDATTTTFTFTWEYSAPPAHDDIENAYEMIGASEQIEHTCVGATPQLPADDPLADPDNPYNHASGYATVWYKYEATENGLIQFRIRYPDEPVEWGWVLDDGLIISCRGELGSLEELAFTDFGTFEINDLIYVEVLDQYVEAGNTYYFGVSQFGTPNEALIDDDWGGDYMLEWRFIAEEGIEIVPAATPDPGTVENKLYPASAGDIVIPFTEVAGSINQRIINFWRYQWSDFDGIANVGDRSKFFISLEKADNTVIKALQFYCSASSGSSRTYQIRTEADVTLKTTNTGSTPYTFTVTPTTGVLFPAGNGNQTGITALYDASVSGTGSRTWSFFWQPTRITGLAFPVEQIRFGQFGSGTAIPFHWRYIRIDDDTGTIYESDFDVGADEYANSADDWVPLDNLSGTEIYNTTWQGTHTRPDVETFQYDKVIETSLGALKADTSYDPASKVQVLLDGMHLLPGPNGDNGGVDVWFSSDPDAQTYDAEAGYSPDNFTFEIGVKAERFQQAYRDSGGTIEPFGGLSIGCLEILFQITENNFYAQYENVQGTTDLIIVSENWFYRFKTVYDKDLDVGSLIPGRITSYYSADRGLTWDKIHTSEFEGVGRPSGGGFQNAAYAYRGDWELVIEGIQGNPATGVYMNFTI